MGYSRKKVIRVGILIIVLLSIVALFVQCNRNRYSAKIYSDENEILSIFHENTEEFDQMAKILHLNAFFDDRWEEYGDRTMFSPYTFKWKKYFSKEKYEEIERFYLDFRPYEITDREWKYVQIVFLSKTATLSFFYINIADNHYSYEVDAEEWLKSELLYLSQDYEVIPLGNNWYYRISPPPVAQD